MKKRSYHSKNVKTINWEKHSQQHDNKDLVFSIDIAKEKQFDQIMNEDREVLLQVNNIKGSASLIHHHDHLSE